MVSGDISEDEMLCVCCLLFEQIEEVFQNNGFWMVWLFGLWCDVNCLECICMFQLDYESIIVEDIIVVAEIYLQVESVWCVLIILCNVVELEQGREE